MRRNFLYLLASAAVLSLASCTTTKFVPDGSYLLDEVKIRTDQKNIRPSSLRMYVRQNPNAKWFSLIKTQLYVYNLSGRDSTKWGNKFLRRIGAVSYTHLPFENKELLDNRQVYPADFIAEGVDQTRGWFFTLHAIATMVFDSVSYKAVISNGLVLDKNGNKTVSYTHL